MIRHPVRSARTLGLALTLLLASCATAGTAGMAGGGSSSGALTAQDLAASSQEDLYTALQHLRPLWLQVRGGKGSLQEAATLSVFVDGLQQQEGVQFLRTLRTVDVQEVRYLTATEATTRYGTNMTGGALEIVTKH